jgi:hypothetical protein
MTNIPNDLLSLMQDIYEEGFTPFLNPHSWELIHHAHVEDSDTVGSDLYILKAPQHLVDEGKCKPTVTITARSKGIPAAKLISYLEAMGISLDDYLAMQEKRD